MRDDRGWGMMLIILTIRHSREIAIAAVLGMAAALVWGLIWMLK
jgi:hypothetical protein